ncbi:MAG: hypothetical protein ABSF77_12810 [Spirochaetia bacterium]|jgi:hypothetical protein
MMMKAKNLVMMAEICLFALSTAACSSAQATGGFEGFWGSYQPESPTPVDTFMSISRLDSGQYLILWVNTSTAHPANSVTFGVMAGGDKLTFRLGKTLMALTHLSDKRGEYLSMSDSEDKVFDEYFRVSKIPGKNFKLTSK